MIGRVACLLALQCCWLAFSTSAAQAQSTEDAVRTLGEGNLREMGAAVEVLGRSGDPAVVPVLQALGDGDLYADDNGAVVIREGGGDPVDPLTGEMAGSVDTASLSRIRINNSLRRDVQAAIGGLTLLSDIPEVRLSAARQMFGTADPSNLALLDEAIEAETDPAILRALEQAHAASILQTDVSEDAFARAVATIADRGDRQAMAILNANLANASDEKRAEIEAGIATIERSLALWGIAQNVWYGLSLGSVLLLAAIGLAITFGVMGVINMAHGEMVMIGAYTTFVVQEIIRTSMPAAFDYSLAIALSAAFIVTALVGIAIERGIIRWLYGRPLETLLATWGVSLILQQSVRTIFGATNRDVGNPAHMSGAFELGGLLITWSRLWIVVFSLVVFAVLLFVLSRTSLGLQMRAVTQNRRMASSMGIRTPWVDAMTFGLGSGIAGLAGVALSQIDNVSPNLGQGYLIDSFLVVVFGGVGSLWGALIAAFSLGIVNKFLEPYAGAVLAKILILVFIILFIQRRPRGLFAIRGRAADL